MANPEQRFIHLLSAMSPNTSILFIVTLWASVEDGLGLPVVKQMGLEATEGVPPHRERTRRCACSTPLDSECHYFCHLDIIWVNTPSKTTIYGLGSALSRRRRSTLRCTCANRADQTCTSFCHHRAAARRSKRVLDATDLDQTQRKHAR